MSSRHDRVAGSKRLGSVIPLVVLGLAIAAPLEAQSAPDLAVIDGTEITELSLEDLMAVDVTSVEGSERSWFTTPAAVHVIRGTDLRRSGVLHLPEALRLSPGVYYGQISSSTFSVASRGFGGRFASKLLVLQDGRAVYDPGFSGVYWDIQGPLLADLDRIEVVRGPGATLWGSNAVNGVINVSTLSAEDTQGLLVSAGAGTYERAFGSIRYGGTMGERTWYRVWGKYFQRDHTAAAGGANLHDAWELAKGGVRIDGECAADLHWSFQAEGYDSPRLDEEVRIPVTAAVPTTREIEDSSEASGGFASFEVGNAAERGLRWTLKGYYDRTERQAFGGLIADRDTFDVDLRQIYSGLDRHELHWGASVRHTRDHVHPNPAITLTPLSRSLDTFSAFFQDTWTLSRDRLFLMIGTKAEHNDTTGFEVQPSARFWWTPNSRATLWTSFSRAVRVPSRVDDDIALTIAFADTGILGGGPPSGTIIPLQLLGDRRVKSEVLLISELGVRLQPTRQLTLDLSAFQGFYDPLITTPDGTVGSITNRGRARSSGAEFAATWQIHQRLQLSGNLSMLHVDVQRVEETAETDTPSHMAQLHVHYELSKSTGVDLATYYVDSTRSQDASSFVTADLGVSWNPYPELRLSIWGKNLIDHRHRESSDDFFQSRATLVERSVFAELELRF